MAYRTHWQRLMDQERRRQMKELRDVLHEIRLGYARVAVAQLKGKLAKLQARSA